MYRQYFIKITRFYIRLMMITIRTAKQITLPSVSMAIFPCGPGLAGFIKAKDDRTGGDN